MRLPGPLSGYATLLGSAPSFRLLFGATAVSGLGTWLSVIALTVDVFDRTHSGVWVSALLIADFLPAVAIGLLLGPLVDRLSRKRLLVVADLVRLGVFIVLPFTTAAGQVVALALVAGVATGFARPSLWAGLPNLVGEEALPSANAMLRMGDSMTQMGGTLLGGVLVAASGPDLAYGLNAGSFLLSAALLLAIPTRLFHYEAAESRGHWLDLREGFAAIRGSRPLIAVLISWNLVMLSIAATNVAEVVLAKVSYGAGDLGFGLMWTATGIGAAVGAVLAPAWLQRRGMSVVYGLGIGLMAFGDLIAAVAPNIWVALWAILLGGMGNAAAIVVNSLLVQRGAPDHLRGRAFTVIMGSNFAVLGLAMAVTGPITDAVGARWVWGGAAGFAALGAIVGYGLLRGQPETAAAEPAPL